MPKSNPECFIPIYKTCPLCDGSGVCYNCRHSGTVRVLIPLDEFADLIGMSSEALHNLKLRLGGN